MTRKINSARNYVYRMARKYQLNKEYIWFMLEHEYGIKKGKADYIYPHEANHIESILMGFGGCG